MLCTLVDLVDGAYRCGEAPIDHTHRGGMVGILDPVMGASARAGVDGSGWAVELACGVVERSITV